MSCKQGEGVHFRNMFAIYVHKAALEHQLKTFPMGTHANLYSLFVLGAGMPFPSQHCKWLDQSLFLLSTMQMHKAHTAHTVMTQ